MRVLVTGGCGLVGRHTVIHHLHAGDHVTVVDSMHPNGGAVDPRLGWGSLPDPRDWPGHVTWVHRDCRRVFDVWREQDRVGEFDLVHHLAAVVGGRRTIDHSPLLVADCMSIDVAMVQWANECCPGHVIYYSSSAAYPIWRQDHATLTADKLPGRRLAEWMIPSDTVHDVGVPDQTYGWSKLTGERLMSMLDVPHTIYRPFSGYAEDQAEGYPMVDICRRALALEAGQPMTVWGPGTQVRDWVHIDDVVRWVSLSWRDGGVLNLCSGRGTSMLELGQTAALVATGSVRPCVGTPGQPTGVMWRVGDPAEMARRLGAAADCMVPLDAGLRRVVDHLRSERQ